MTDKYNQIIQFLDENLLIAVRADEFIKKTQWLYEDRHESTEEVDELYDLLLDMVASYHAGQPLVCKGGIV